MTVGKLPWRQWFCAGKYSWKDFPKTYEPPQ